MAALAVARRWDVAVVALVVFGAAQVALLVSPAVYGRTRPVPVPVRAPGWATLLRRPPTWLLVCGLAAGALVTLACLGSPLRWLTARQNVLALAGSPGRPIRVGRSRDFRSDLNWWTRR